MGSARNRAGMARYGINVERAFGVPVTTLRRLAKQEGVDHRLALALWETGKHEARILACFVEDPVAVTARQADAWAREFDSWDLCDQVCTSLLDRTSHGWPKAKAWAARSEPWIKRAGFALMAGLASHDRSAPDRAFVELLPLMERGAFDGRDHVKKAVSWAMRGVGKRNLALHAAVITCAERLREGARVAAGAARGADADARAARWIASDVLRELSSEAVTTRLRSRATRGPRGRSVAKRSARSS